MCRSLTLSLSLSLPLYIYIYIYIYDNPLKEMLDDGLDPPRRVQWSIVRLSERDNTVVSKPACQKCHNCPSNVIHKLLHKSIVRLSERDKWDQRIINYTMCCLLFT